MKIKFLSGLLAATVASLSIQEAAAQGFRINEVDAQTAGTDVAEFVEIFNAAGAVSLSGHALVFFNGSNNTEYQVFDLGNVPDVGALTTDANGFLSHW